MKFAVLHPRSLFSRKTLGADIKAGLVLGIEGVPDNLSSGVLAAVNPVAAVYAGIFGTAGAALFTSSALMPVQTTGAMSIIVRDSHVGRMANPTGALATLTILTGVFMIIAGVLHGGRVTRFVSQAVTTGFLAAVGVNIILGQFTDITGFQSAQGRVLGAFDSILHVTAWNMTTAVIGIMTASLIIILRRTRLGGMAYVAAIVAAWIVAWLVRSRGGSVPVVSDIAAVPTGLPLPVLPDLTVFADVVVPALSLAFVGLVQGAGVARSTENPDGSIPNASQDFVGQGAGNVFSGLFRGMPVGGSASGTVLARTSGAGSRGALFVTSIVMAVLILVLSPVVALVPLAGLAGMLLVVGADTIPVGRLRKTLTIGPLPRTVTVVTFVLTLVIPLQFAVLVGVGVSIVLFAVGASQTLILKQVVFETSGPREIDPPAVIGTGEVLVIQPYGTVFFASAARMVEQMPQVGPESHRSVLIVRLRGEQSPSTTLVDALAGYARRLQNAGCQFVLVTTSDELIQDLRNYESDAVDPRSIPAVYLGDDRVGATVRQAYDDAVEWTKREASEDPS